MGEYFRCGYGQAMHNLLTGKNTTYEPICFNIRLNNYLLQIHWVLIYFFTPKFRKIGVYSKSRKLNFWLKMEIWWRSSLES